MGEVPVRWSLACATVASLAWDTVQKEGLQGLPPWCPLSPDSNCHVLGFRGRKEARPPTSIMLLSDKPWMYTSSSSLPTYIASCSGSLLGWRVRYKDTFLLNCMGLCSMVLVRHTFSKQTNTLLRYLKKKRKTRHNILALRMGESICRSALSNKMSPTSPAHDW